MNNISVAPILHKNDLIHYVRGKHGQRRGVVIARNFDGRVSIGWSAVNAKAGDSYNQERALTIALGRCQFGTKETPPHDVRRVLEKFPERCLRYFKGAQLAD